MRIERCIKGVKTGLPLSSIGIDGDGWTHGEPPEEGILVVLEGQDKAAGGALVTASVLRKNGYVNVEPARKRLANLKKEDLWWLAESIGLTPNIRRVTHYTKAQLVEMILG